MNAEIVETAKWPPPKLCISVRWHLQQNHLFFSRAAVCVDGSMWDLIWKGCLKFGWDTLTEDKMNKTFIHFLMHLTFTLIFHTLSFSYRCLNIIYYMLCVTLENVNVRMWHKILSFLIPTHTSSLLSCADICHALGSKVPTVCAQVYICISLRSGQRS